VSPTEKQAANEMGSAQRYLVRIDLPRTCGVCAAPAAVLAPQPISMRCYARARARAGSHVQPGAAALPRQQTDVDVALVSSVQPMPDNDLTDVNTRWHSIHKISHRLSAIQGLSSIEASWSWRATVAPPSTATAGVTEHVPSAASPRHTQIRPSREVHQL